MLHHRLSRRGRQRSLLVRGLRDRAVTLVATVLACTIAATIAMAVVYQSAMDVNSVASTTAAQQARSLAQQAVTKFAQLESADPTFWRTDLFVDERPRLCATPPQGMDDPWVVAGGATTAWPAACGSSWTYPAVGQQVPGWVAGDHPVRAEIVQPTAADPRLHLRVLASANGAEAGIDATFGTDSVSAYTVWTASDLHVGDVFRGTGSAPVAVSGQLYSGGQVWLDGDVDLSAARVGAEAGIVGTVPEGGAGPHLAAGTGEAGTTPLRDEVPYPLTTQALSTRTQILTDDVCGGWLAASSMCLRPGATLTPADGGDPVIVPAGVRGWLLRTTGTKAAPTLSLYYSTAELGGAVNCQVLCDPYALAAADIAAGRHPGGALPAGGVKSAWSELGVFPAPVSGVVATDADTYLSHCADFSTASACAVEPDTAVAGMSVPTSLTVLAGTLSDPADVYLSGPISATDGARLGVVATGSIVVPYWANAKGGTLNVDASLLALGDGISGPSVTTLPAVAPFAATLNLDGSLAAADLSSPLAGYAATTINGDPSLSESGPPQFPGFSHGWAQTGTRPLTSAQVCGTSQPTCAGLW